MDCAANVSRTDGQWHLNVLGQRVHGELGLYSGSPVSRTCITNQPWGLVGTSHKHCWKGWVCDDASLMGQGQSLKQKGKRFYLNWAIHVRIFMHLDISKDLEEDLKFICWWSQWILPWRVSLRDLFPFNRVRGIKDTLALTKLWVRAPSLNWGCGSACKKGSDQNTCDLWQSQGLLFLPILERDFSGMTIQLIDLGHVML